MKMRYVLAIGILVALFSAPAFGQENTEMVSAIKSLIDSGSVIEITAFHPGAGFVQGNSTSMKVTVFKISETHLLVLEDKKIEFVIDLTRVAVYAFNAKSGTLTIWIM